MLDSWTPRIYSVTKDRGADGSVPFKLIIAFELFEFVSTNP